MYGKLFQSLYQGTMRGHGDLILVFTNLLAFKDQDQYVDKTALAIAQEVGLSEERVRAALDILEAPDPSSRSKASEGRRLLRIDDHRDWGWFVVNGEFYDRIRDAAERRRQNREAQEAKRKRDRQQESAPVSSGQQESAMSASGSGSVAGAGNNTPKGVEQYSTPFLGFWMVYPKKVAKADAWKSWKRQKLDEISPAICADVSHRWPDVIRADRLQFIPYPATYLNRRHWEDETPQANGSQPVKETRAYTTDDASPYPAGYVPSR